MIYTINTSGHLLYPVAKSAFEMSDDDVYKMINDEFCVMVDRLEKKGVKYDNLKRALIPNQNKNNNEVCLAFDSSLIDSSSYGYVIFEKILPLLDKKSTYSILAGDYIDVINNLNNSQQQLKVTLEEVLIKRNDSVYKHSSQYYLVYINSITNNQLSSITNELKKVKWFYGYALLNKNSIFKTYLSFVLSHICIKTKDTIILNHSSDYDDSENINLYGYPFKENGFKLISINEDSFGPFLSYKIESILPDKDDISFSFNALFPKFNSMEKLQLNLADGRWDYLNGNIKGKDGILKSFDLTYFNNHLIITIETKKETIIPIPNKNKSVIII